MRTRTLTMMAVTAATLAIALASSAQATPATLSLTVGAPSSFDAFIPGVEKTYEASMTALVSSTAGEATLTVHDGTGVAVGHLVNGAYSLKEVLQVRASNASNTGTVYNNVVGPDLTPSLLTYSGPVSNDSVSVEFSQHIGANDPVRPGTYGKELTFTLSTTTPCRMATTVTVVVGNAGQITADSPGSVSCNAPPDCTAVTASPKSILPATRDQFKAITLAGATDPDGDALAFHIDSVTQDEPVAGSGVGDDTMPDARLVAGAADTNQVEVRAERNPQGNGRVYRIGYTVSDGNGGSCTDTETVFVVRKKSDTAIDDGSTRSWDSFTGTPIPST